MFRPIIAAMAAGGLALATSCTAAAYGFNHHGHHGHYGAGGLHGHFHRGHGYGWRGGHRRWHRRGGPHRGLYVPRAPGASAFYYGRHGGVGLSLPLVHDYRYHGRTTYFGGPGTVIRERHYHGGVGPFGFGRGPAIIRCGAHYCVRRR